MSTRPQILCTVISHTKHKRPHEHDDSFLRLRRPRLSKNEEQTRIQSSSRTLWWKVACLILYDCHWHMNCKDLSTGKDSKGITTRKITTVDTWHLRNHMQDEREDYNRPRWKGHLGEGHGKTSLLPGGVQLTSSHHHHHPHHTEARAQCESHSHLPNAPPSPLSLTVSPQSVQVLPDASNTSARQTHLSSFQNKKQKEKPQQQFSKSVLPNTSHLTQNKKRTHNNNRSHHHRVLPPIPIIPIHPHPHTYPTT
ncbi:hypothetical protein BC835DRAFT_431630 [Cytidiella melzeri]|nr:hypothetical protein BC835DRAFT_431630 [Cytidiella melzeri]